jgi:hypothetical protein
MYAGNRRLFNATTKKLSHTSAFVAFKYLRKTGNSEPQQQFLHQLRTTLFYVYAFHPTEKVIIGHVTTISLYTI